ncbi:MAG: Tetratricopeptide 2 repeat protein [Myxococcales bacterium]|nr:Tetratricopeptide 2 repeat protein [Myxococcales bacterium]
MGNSGTGDVGTIETVKEAEMPMDLATLPATSTEIGALVERLRTGRCVLCAGSRLGSSDGARSFRGLVEKLLSSLPEADAEIARQVLESRPLAAAGYIRRRLGDRFAEELKKAAAPYAELSDAVRLLGELPFRAVVTTSYDDSYERTFTKDGVMPRIYTPRDADELKKDGKLRFVFKALGDPSRADSIVWSAEDLQTALADGGYRTVAHDLYRSRSFLFVGFDGRDPDLAILLERVLSGARAGDVEHFAVLPGLGAVEKEELYAAYRIRVLAEDNVATLAAQLKELIGDEVGPALPDDDDFEGWLALLAEEPTRTDALDRLDALSAKLRELNDWEKLVDLMLGRVGVEPTAERRAEMLLDVARLFEQEVGDLSKAFTALVAAYKEHPRPEGSVAWNELERLAKATGMWSELLAELVEVVPTLPDGERAQAWLRIARLYGDKLNAAEYALTSLDEALTIDPTLTDAAELRLSLLRRLERWSELATALGEAQRFVEQAELYETRMGDGTAAAAAYKKALDKDPLQHEARGAFEQLLRRTSDWRGLATVLDERAGYAAGDEAKALKSEAASLFADRLDDKKAAIARYEALAADDKRDLATLRALERLYKADGQEKEYIECLGRQAEAVDSDRERAALYRRMASLWEEIPGSVARAEECLEKLLAVDPRSEDALRSLERLYYAERKWTELIDACRRHAQLVPPPNAGEIHFQVGAIYEHELKDPTRAIEAYLDVETALPNHGDTMEALTRVYEKTGQWQKTADVIERRAQLAEVKSLRLELHHRAGEIYAEKIGDAKQAETRFVRALEIDPTHVPSMTALVEIYRKNGDFLKAAKLLVEAVPHTSNRLERTRLLVEAGEIYDGLDDKRKATELYLDALAVDPEHVEAGERVGGLLWQAERFADLVPVLEMLTRKDAEPALQVERLTRLAHAAMALGQDDKVGKAYTRAAEIDETHLVAQRGRAEWHLKRGEHKEALGALEKVFQHHVEDLPPSERVELLYGMGACELKLGNKTTAKELIQRALELDPAHRPSLLASMELGEAKPESVIDAKKALLVTANLEEQAKLLGEIGDIWMEKLQNRDEAVSAWREGLELKSDDHKLLHKCLDAYVEDKSWPQALEMLERLIENEKSQTVRAKYRHAAGLICRDELGRAAEAAAHLSAALDDDWTLERSAESLEELLKDRQEWKDLARFYRKTLKRLGAESPGNADGKNAQRLRIWSELGEVCLSKLGERESALAALEVALTFERGNLDRRKQLADLYVQAGPDKFDKSILEHQHILQREKNRVLSYRALKHLYIQTGQREKSVQLSVALTFLKKGEDDDLRKVAAYKGQPMAIARRVMSDEMWVRLQHPDEDRYLDTLFALVTPMLATASAQQHKTLGLNRKEALAVDDPRSFAKTLKYVTTTLGVAPPEAYVRADQKEAVAFANCIDKTTLVPVFSLGAPLVGDKRQEREQVFELARRAAHLRPERFVRFILPQPQQLGHIIESAMALGDEPAADRTPTSTVTGEMGKTVAAMRRALTPVQLEQVASIGRKLKADGIRPEEAALKWLQAADLTAIRAGFVMTGDLEASALLIAAEPQPATALPATQRLLDLVWSSATEELFAVRKQLGMM